MQVIRCLSVVVLALMCSSVLAQSTTVEVEIKSVDANARAITVIYKGKSIQLDVSRKASVTIAGTESKIDSLLPGDKATIEYHKDLEVVTKIEAQGVGKDGWRFCDVFGKAGSPDRAIVVARDGSLVCHRNSGFCLASLREFSEFTFKVEFQLPVKDVKGNSYIGVASTLPNPKASDWAQQIPKGIEVKLRPDNIGELVLPSADFKVELPLGQLRDERKVVQLRKPELKATDWNTLEITCDKHQNVTVKVNGTTVNAVAKAEKTTGHIVIWPPNAEMRLRNPVVLTGETERKLSFDEIAVE